MRLYGSFLFYVQQFKDYKRFLVCYDLDKKKEFGREKFNLLAWEDNLNCLNQYSVVGDFVVMLSDNFKSFKSISLEKNESEKE